MQAVKCPVCNGSGKVKDPNYDPDTTTGKQKNVTCHGCGGKGWVEVHEQPYPYYPYPWTPDPIRPIKPWGPPWTPWEYWGAWR